ncbi:MAG: hypothetical protein QOF14_2742 [Hyphomicrobiales bacterium]|jgi:hypothetical protein|nr:hypothetical protein [Hyphomicrobiales bacterium]
MSVKQGIGALAIAILISTIGPSGAQEASASVDVAKAGILLSLTENSWDFTKPDSIPGFGTLPQNYDAKAVLPKLSGK